MERFLKWLRDVGIGLGIMFSGICAIAGVLKITQLFGKLIVYVRDITLVEKIDFLTGATRGIPTQEFLLGLRGWAIIGLVIVILQGAKMIGEEF